MCKDLQGGAAAIWGEISGMVNGQGPTGDSSGAKGGISGVVSVQDECARASRVGSSSASGGISSVVSV